MTSSYWSIIFWPNNYCLSQQFYFLFVYREIARMKNKSGSGELAGDDEDFQVVPVESTSM